MERKTIIQLVVGIIIGLLILMVIYAVLSFQSYTDSPRHTGHEIDVQIEISEEEQALFVEVEQSSLDFGNYIIIVGENPPNASIFKNLTGVGYRGDIVKFTSPEFKPIEGEIIKVSIVYNDPSEVCWRSEIEVR